MSVEVRLKCNGCFAESEPFVVRARHESIFNGSGSGWCLREVDKIEDVAPEGWVALDPYTLCTYCPTCWAGIQGGPTKRPADGDPANDRA